MTPLKARWGAFLTLILDPWCIVLFTVTILLVIAQVLQTDRILITTFTVLVAVSSGVFGGVLGKKWDELSGERVIVASGKVAIRSLKHLLTETVALKRRVDQYLERCTEGNGKKKRAPEIVTTYLEEIADECILLEEGILNSIESWTDIIPEADVKTQIGVITELHRKADNLKQEITALDSELRETKGKSSEEIERLRVELERKDEELSALRHEISVKATTAGMGMLVSSVMTAITDVLNQLGEFELKRSKSGQFMFNLKAANGQTILISELYKNKTGAKDGIESVKKNATNDSRYERKTSSKKEPYFVLKAANGQTIGKSEMYSSTSAMEKGIASVKANAPGAAAADLAT